MSAMGGNETAVNEALIANFQQNGCAVLRGAFAPWVEGLKQGIEENMANPSFRERTYHPDDGSAQFFQDFCNWDRIAGYRALVRESPMARIAARLMRSKGARIFHDHVLVKEPGTSVATPWHQDSPYYLVKGSMSVSFWVPLDPVPRDRTIEFIAGSHLAGKEYRPDRFDGTRLYAGDQSEPVHDIEGNRDAHQILGWAVEPGDAVAFNFRTLHGAPANASAERRRVISVRWVGDDARFVRRLGRTSPPFPDLEYEDGASFEAPEFPLIHPA